MTYKVVLTHTDEGYSVGCPELPGCWSQGRTEEEAISNIQGAIQRHLLAQPSEPAAATVRYIEVPDTVADHGSSDPSKHFEVQSWSMGLPVEWTSHKVEDLLDILEGPDRR